MVYFFGSNHRSDLASVLALDALDMVTELGSLILQTSLHLLTVIVLERAILHREDARLMLDFEGLLISDGLP
jgi:hypothetical protein